MLHLLLHFIIVILLLLLLLLLREIYFSIRLFSYKIKSEYYPHIGKMHERTLAIPILKLWESLEFMPEKINKLIISFSNRDFVIER